MKEKRFDSKYSIKRLFCIGKFACFHLYFLFRASGHEILLHVEEVVVEYLFLSPVYSAFSVHVVPSVFEFEVKVVKLALISADMDVSSQHLLRAVFSLHVCELCQVLEEACVDELVVDLVVDPALKSWVG